MRALGPPDALKISASSLVKPAKIMSMIALVLGLLVNGALADSKQVLMLNSFGRDFRPWSEYAKAIRTELERQSPWYMDVQDHPAVIARSADDDSEVIFADYIRALYRKKPPDLIIAVGAPAALFVQRRRGHLFPNVPMLLTAVDERFLQQSPIADAAVAVRIEIPPLFDNILRLLPETKTVIVTLGASPVERRWRTEMEKSLEAFKSRVDVIFCTDMSFEELLRLAKAPPSNAVILWTPLRVDVAGVTLEGDLPLKRLYAATNAPIFSYDDVFFNGEIVGGPMLPTADVVREATTAAIRLLSGENASDIKVSPIGYAAPKYDWRQLQRWKIDTKLLPPESTVLFRQQTGLERYRWQIVLFGAVVLLQTSLITGLLYERRLRNTAEMEAQRRLSELAHVNRQATAGELSTSITHELNQPLGAIRANVDTAELILNAQSPDLTEIRHIIADIRRDDERASAIIGHLRSLLKKSPLEFKRLDLGVIVREVIEILDTMARSKKIAILYAPPAAAVWIQGDAIQLQQVLVNLIVNSIDAISDNECVKREVAIGVAAADRFAEVTVSDSGPGISIDKLQRIFDPFFTTKQHGMGMGLSIVQTIVRAHNGQVSVDHQRTGGAVFRVRLPIVSSE